jgi:hypothetical protein
MCHERKAPVVVAARALKAGTRLSIPICDVLSEDKDLSELVRYGSSSPGI